MLYGTRRALLGGNRLFYIASPTAVTPVTGDELVANGDMETGDPPSSWSAAVAPSTFVADADVHGGLQSGRFAKNGGANWGIQQNVTPATAGFYLVSSWSKTLSGNSRYYLYTVPGYGTTAFSGDFNYATWTQRSGCYFTPQNWLIAIGSNDGEALFDDISIKRLTLSSLLGNITPAFSSGTFIASWPTAPTNGHRVGLVLCLDSTSSPATFILATHNGTYAYLDKWVAGTYTSVIGATAAAWSNGAELKLIKRGSAVELWYNNVQVSTTQTITGMSNAYAAWFSTNGSLLPTYFRGYQ